MRETCPNNIKERRDGESELPVQQLIDTRDNEFLKPVLPSDLLTEIINFPESKVNGRSSREHPMRLSQALANV